MQICIVLFSIASWADDNFDATRNYQGNDASVYVGEILDVNNPPEGVEYYSRFKSYSFDAGQNEDFGERFQGSDYMFHADGYRGMGTEVKWLIGKSFKVVGVEQYIGSRYNEKWILHLRNIDDSNEYVNYIYYGDPNLLSFYSGEAHEFHLFPFTCRKYKGYQAKLEEEREAARIAEVEAKRIADSIRLTEETIAEDMHMDGGSKPNTFDGEGNTHLDYLVDIPWWLILYGIVVIWVGIWEGCFWKKFRR